MKHGKNPLHNTEERKTMDTYETLIEMNIATEEEISLVTAINGNSEETYLDILFVRTGCRTLEQLNAD